MPWYEIDLAKWGVMAVLEHREHAGHIKVGLLGGSFNPAHAGHVYISRMAIRALALDAVWWLVSPQNPLKSATGMAPLPWRLAWAHWVAASCDHISVLDLESRTRTRYAVDTLGYLRRRYPHYRFVWLMGADNLAQVSRWQRWPSLFHLVPVAVLARCPYSLRALAGVAAQRFGPWRVAPSQARALAGRKCPAWAFLPIPLHPDSATRIRSVAGVWWKRIEKEQTINNPICSTIHTFDPDNLIDLIKTSLANDKAEDVIAVDLNGKTSFTDYMIIATGHSARQIGAMAEHLRKRLKVCGIIVGIEGVRECNWVLLDAGDVVIHLFRLEVRAFYNLEKMWRTSISPDSIIFE